MVEGYLGGGLGVIKNGEKWQTTPLSGPLLKPPPARARALPRKLRHSGRYASEHR